MDATIAGELLGAITGMAGATKAVAEAMKAVKAKVKGNAEAEQVLSGAMDHVLTLQERMIDLQATVLGLQQELAQSQHENAALRQQIRREEERAADRQEYQRRKVGQAIVLVREDEPDVYYCTTCFEKSGHSIPLQAHPLSGKGHCRYCSTCSTVYQIVP